MRCASLAVMWLVAAVVLASLTWPLSVPQLGVGVVAGVVVGVLQARSIALAPAAFLEATMALEVRRALTSTRPGKLALTVQWVAAGVLIAVSLLSLVWAADAKNPALGVLSGYMALMAVRDLVSMRALQTLAARARPMAENG